MTLDLESARISALRNSRTLQVLQYEAPAARADITVADAFFDLYVGAGAYGGKYDRQVSNLVQTFGGNFQEQQTDFLNPYDENGLYIGSQLRTGGEWELGLSSDFLNLSPVGDFVIVNPAWFSAINFHFEQPLGIGRGADVAELQIAIASAVYGQTDAQVRDEINGVLREVEIAYLDVLQAEAEYRALAEIMEQANETAEAANTLLEKGAGTRPDVLEAEEQLYQIEFDLVDTQQRYATSRQELLRVVGEPIGSRLVVEAIDESELLSEPDWETGVANVLNRPALRAQRQVVRQAELELNQQLDQLRPDVRMVFDYSITGLDDGLDDSFDIVGENRFNDWAVGLTYVHPLGKRAERAQVRKAKLTLCRERAVLDELRHDLLHELEEAYLRLDTARTLVTNSQRRLESAQRLFDDRVELYEKRRGNVASLVLARERLINAVLRQTQAEIAYRKAVVEWSFVQGSLLRTTATVAAM